MCCCGRWRRRCVVLLGGPFCDGAWQALRAARLSTPTRWSAIGVLAAYGYSACRCCAARDLVYFDTASMVLLLFTLGRYLEAQGRARAARSLAPMLAAERAEVRGGRARRRRSIACPVREVRAGELVRVLPGERIAVDGVVIEGRSECDEAIAHRPAERRRPRRRARSCIAGSINGNGALLMRATVAGRQTRWMQIGRLVREALASKSLAGERSIGSPPPSSRRVLLLAAATAWFWSGRARCRRRAARRARGAGRRLPLLARAGRAAGERAGDRRRRRSAASWCAAAACSRGSRGCAASPSTRPAR